MGRSRAVGKRLLLLRTGAAMMRGVCVLGASLLTGAGVFLLASAQSEQISFLLDCVVRGVSPTRGPFGLRPVFPGQCPGSAYLSSGAEVVVVVVVLDLSLIFSGWKNPQDAAEKRRERHRDADAADRFKGAR